MPRVVFYRDGFIKINVRLESFKKDTVEGNISFSIEDADTNEIIFEKNSLLQSNQITLEISFITDLGINELSDTRKFIMHVKFMDNVYKKEVTANADFSILLSDYRLQLAPSRDFFKIGMTHTLIFLLSNLINERKLDSVTAINVTIKTDKNVTVASGIFPVKSNSVIVKTSKIPENSDELCVVAILDEVQYKKIIHKYHTVQNESITFSLLTSR